MLHKNFIKHWVIKIRRYIFRQPFMPVMAGPLKDYMWSTSSSYDYILGEYEGPATLKKFISWLKPDSIFYDVGANVGYHSLLANSIIQNGVIYAFEPMPFVRGIFEKHIKLNSRLIGKNNISVLPMAISNETKEVIFSNDPTHRDGNTYIPESYIFKGTGYTIKIPCKSIDGLIAEGYQIPDIIKIDVEGAEYDVLLGAKKTLVQYHPHILLATHDCHLPGVQQKCIEFLKELGYETEHTGNYHKYMDGLDDYIAIHKSRQ